ncbi:TPA: hypothetical protein ACE6RK_000751, partial [Neisseria gonorrhoeae]
AEEKRREEKRREEKRREEKRRFFAGWIHFRFLIRFDRLKKKIFTDVERRIISGLERCANTYSELNLNQYSVGPPCRTICTACGWPPCPDFC